MLAPKREHGARESGVTDSTLVTILLLRQVVAYRGAPRGPGGGGGTSSVHKKVCFLEPLTNDTIQYSQHVIELNIQYGDSIHDKILFLIYPQHTPVHGWRRGQTNDFSSS